MKKFSLIFLDTAKQDIVDLSNTIRFEYKSPLTAVKYLHGLYNAINGLRNNAETYALQSRSYFLHYGFNVRRLNYKKMVIIYTIIDDTIYVQRVIPSSMVTGF